MQNICEIFMCLSYIYLKLYRKQDNSMKKSEVSLERSISTPCFLPVGSHSSGRVPRWFLRSCVLVLCGPEVGDQPKAWGCRKNRGQASNAAENEVALRRDHLLEHTCGNNGKSYRPKYCRQENLIKQDFGSETPLVIENFRIFHRNEIKICLRRKMFQLFQPDHFWGHTWALQQKEIVFLCVYE